MSLSRLIAIVVATLFTTLAVAGTINVPAKNAVITVNIPDAWEPEETDKGIACESPDKIVTVFFDIANSSKSLESLIDENIDWLVKEQSVRIDAATKKDGEMAVGDMRSSVLRFDANSKKYGPAKVGFIFTPVGEKILLTTCWISVKGFQKQEATLNLIIDSIKPVR